MTCCSLKRSLFIHGHISKVCMHPEVKSQRSCYSEKLPWSSKHKMDHSTQPLVEISLENSVRNEPSSSRFSQPYKSRWFLRDQKSKLYRSWQDTGGTDSNFPPPPPPGASMEKSALKRLSPPTTLLPSDLPKRVDHIREQLNSRLEDSPYPE